jgi:hypothetical protein
VKTFAYFIGGPRDGEQVDPHLLSAGPTIVVPIPQPLRAYFTRESHLRLEADHVKTIAYREAPPMRVADRAVFRFFVCETEASDRLDAMVEMLHTAMRHRTYARTR